jgi:predicted NAD-dependent protein-ADP-ribosyltransferase YbiA (DUF1768 family)
MDRLLDRALLCGRCAAGEKFTYVFFWGHTVPKDGSIAKTCFSQWYPAAFEIDGIVYPTAVH